PRNQAHPQTTSSPIRWLRWPRTTISLRNNYLTSSASALGFYAISVLNLGFLLGQ
ncbi:hypothetical protein O181_046533, partial [Austropuccinia psidii MF-1]|nr:hypothetical protein [Austropuccinia psidii MF-1]